jgi:hypothetical protein
MAYETWLPRSSGPCRAAARWELASRRAVTYPCSGTPAFREGNSVAMPEPIDRAQRLPSLDEPNRERRVWVRYPGSLETFCQPLPAETAVRPEISWPAHVWDVSRYGAALLLDRRYEAGTPLLLLTAPEAMAELLSLRVIHSQLQPNGKWLLGCLFDRPLSDAELRGMWHDS